jgi:hypothetical protein
VLAPVPWHETVIVLAASQATVALLATLLLA